MPLHFAYGSNMSRALMRQHCPQARALGTAVLTHYRFIVMADGYASIVRQPGHNVHGVLWQLTPRDLPSGPRPSAGPSPEAARIVAIWNVRQAGGRALWFYPTMGAAIAAGVPWLSFSCPGCGQYASVDLRTLDRHPGGAISGLIPSLSCRRCSPNAPFARPEMLTAERS